jgi:hypothetical protein
MKPRILVRDGMGRDGRKRISRPPRFGFTFAKLSAETGVSGLSLPWRGRAAPDVVGRLEP